MNFSKKLKMLRTEKKLSQSDVAKALNINQTTVSTWELGKKYPDFFSLAALAKFFEVSADYLLGLSEE